MRNALYATRRAVGITCSIGDEGGTSIDMSAEREGGTCPPPRWIASSAITASSILNFTFRIAAK